MIIITKRPGQLGNSLFLFAHFIAFSIEKKKSIVNVAFVGYGDYFPSTSNDNLHRYPPKRSLLANALIQNLYYSVIFYLGRALFKMHLNNKFLSFIELDWNDRLQMDDESKGKVLMGPVVFIYGWGYRCNSYLIKNMDVIRDFFKPFPKYLQSVDGVILPARKKYDVIVGIHIRHGDYAKFAGGKYYYSLAQYAAVMRNAAALFAGKKIGFLVCSNEKQDSAGLGGYEVIDSPGHELEDMYALSRCDYILGPPSTYSMWASFYGNVPLYVIADPEHSFGKKDFILPSKWINEPMIVTP